MNPNTCLLTNFILNDRVVSSSDFNPDELNKGKVIYEVMRVITGSPLFFHEHVERFNYSLINSGCKTTLSKKSITSRIKSLIETNRLKDGNIRFQVNFTSDYKATFSAWACPYYYPQKELYKIGASLSTIKAQRDNPNIKTYNPDLIRNAFSHINKNNIYEVLLLNKDGLITEGSRSNIFFVEGNILTTPPLSSVLPGITRIKVIEIAKKLGITCNETDINYNSLQLFEGAFITGTSPKVLPIGKIDDITFNPNHPTISYIMDNYNDILDSYIAGFSWSQFV